MSVETTASEVFQALRHPAFPGRIDGRDRNVLWFLLTFILAVAAGAVLAVICFIAATIIFFLINVASGGTEGAKTALEHVMALVQNPPDRLDLKDSITAFVLLAAINTPLAAGAVLVAALMGRKPFRMFLTAAPRFRWRLLGAAMVMLPVLFVPLFLLGSLIEPMRGGMPILSVSPDVFGRLIYLLAAFAILIPAAWAEEIVFRGWLLRQSIAFFRDPWIPLVLNGVLFALAHTNPNLDDSLQLGLMGVAFAYMSLRLGGIEFAVGAHAINNILIVLFFQPLTLTPAEAHPFSIVTALGSVLVPGACVLATEIVLRNPRLRAWTGVDRARSDSSAEAFG